MCMPPCRQQDMCHDLSAGDRVADLLALTHSVTAPAICMTMPKSGDRKSHADDGNTPLGLTIVARTAPNSAPFFITVLTLQRRRM